MPLIVMIIMLLPISTFAGTLTSFQGPAKVSDYDYYYKAVSSETIRPNDPLLSSTYSSNTGTKVSDTRFSRFDGQNYYCDMTVSTTTQKQSYSASYIDFYTIYDPCPGQKDDYFCYTSYNEFIQNPASGVPVPTSVYCTYSNYPEFQYLNLYHGDDVVRLTVDGGISKITCTQYPYNCLEYLTTTSTEDTRISYKSYLSLTDLTPRQTLKIEFDNVTIKSSNQPAYIPNFIGFYASYIDENDSPVVKSLSPKSIVAASFKRNETLNTSTWLGRFYIELTFDTAGKDITITPFMTGSASSMYYAKMPIEKITTTVLPPHVVWRYIWDYELLNRIKQKFSDRFLLFKDTVLQSSALKPVTLPSGDPLIHFGTSRYAPRSSSVSESGNTYFVPMPFDFSVTYSQVFPVLSAFTMFLTSLFALRIIIRG